MHTTIVSSKAGQLSWGTTLAAISNIAIATPIFNISQNRKPAAAVTAPATPRVIPRANKALGRTVAAAPYNTDHTISGLRVNSHARTTHNNPANA